MRLMMGDCLERMAEIEDGSVDLVLTDPPYGTTACKWDAVIPFATMWDNVWRVLKPNGAAVFTASQPFTSALVMSQADRFKCEWVWNKVQPTGHFNAKNMPLRVCESVLVFNRGKSPYNPQMQAGRPIKRTKGRDAEDGVYGAFKRPASSSGTTRFPTTLLTISSGRSPNARTVHPTQKPVALMEYLIRTYTNEGETVLDFTMGSGTTGVACANTNRNFIGIERDPTYFQIAKDRIEEAQRRLI